MKLPVTDCNRMTYSGAQITKNIFALVYNYPDTLFKVKTYVLFAVIIFMWTSYSNCWLLLHLKLICGYDIGLKSMFIIAGYG